MTYRLLEIISPLNLLFYLFAYGLACVPTSYWVARIFHRQVLEREKVYSHTATYLWQRMSIGAAIVVVVLDVLKGLIPCAIAHSLDAPPLVIAITGFFAVSGHCFSILLRFAGGHGGATFAGVMLVIAYPAALLTLLINYLMIMLKMRPGLASMIATLAGAAVALFLHQEPLVWLFVIAMVAIVFLRDRLTLAPGKL